MAAGSVCGLFVPRVNITAWLDVPFRSYCGHHGHLITPHVTDVARHLPFVVIPHVWGGGGYSSQLVCMCVCVCYRSTAHAVYLPYSGKWYQYKILEVMHNQGLC